MEELRFLFWLNFREYGTFLIFIPFLNERRIFYFQSKIMDEFLVLFYFLQGGSSENLFESVHKKLYILPDSCTIYPAHDYSGLCSSSVKEEKLCNLRLNKVKKLFFLPFFSTFFNFDKFFIFIFPQFLFF